MVNVPAALTVTRPTCVPAHLSRAGTTARTQIAGLVAKIALAPLPVAGRKAQIVRIAHLASATPLGFDQQGEHLRCVKPLWRCGSNASRIHPVRFDKPRLTRLYFVRPPEPVSKGSPVARRRLLSSHLVALTAVASLSGSLLRQDASQPLLIVEQKLLDSLCPLFPIAGFAGQGQIRHPISAAPRSGHDVLTCKGTLCAPQ